MQTLWKLSQDGKSASRTLDNGSFESRLVTAIDADELATAIPADPISPNVAILAQIAELEMTITPRRIREAVLGTDSNWMKMLDAQITKLRSGIK